MSPELIANYDCETGEGPLWHPGEQRLYWCDIPTGRLFRYDPDSQQHERCYDGDVVGGYTIQEDGSLLLFMEEGRIARWDDGDLETVLEAIPDERNSRFNDVIADPAGRVFCGTMPSQDGLGSLYRLDTDGTLTTVLDAVDVSNGLGFTPETDGLYYAETHESTIWYYDYDETTGAISNRQPFVETTDGPGRPDGLTVDSEGFVWSARWDGGCVVRHAPDGSEDDRVEFPARKVSSVAFGGPDCQDAYVTTAGGHLDPEEEGTGAGGLFRFTPDVSGREEFRSAVEL